jgi:hypothetical protein
LNDELVPPSLRHPDLTELWRQARDRLDRFGSDRRGTIERPIPLDQRADHALRSLLDRRRVPKRLDLAELEAALVGIGVGSDLDGALTTLGYPASVETVERRRRRHRAAARRESLGNRVAAWPEPWAGAWLTEIMAAGLVGDDEGVHDVADDPDGSDESGEADGYGGGGLEAGDGSGGAGGSGLIDQVRRLLDALDDPGVLDRLGTDHADRRSRSDLAALVFGSAHALDTGTPLQRAATRALSHRHPTSNADHREVWERAGFHLDSVSAPVLTWALDLAGPTPLRALVESATAAGVPVHLTNVALQRHPPEAHPGSTVLVVENPRLVEAAAERSIGWPVIATNGNPTTSVITLVSELLSSGAHVLYHGDFDAAGLAICRRMVELGCVPWRMGAVDYQRALTGAERAGTSLPRELQRCGPTPWDPDLQALFDARRLIVHEERLLWELLDQGPPSSAPGSTPSVPSRV